MREIKLLLVEDDEDDYIIARDLLEDIFPGRFSLDWVSDLKSARKQLSANHHDLCLMDYALGAEDGVALLKQATALGFTGPIIMLTGQDDERLDQEALNAGAADYLVKSNLTQSRLARAIRYAIARREMEMERVERLRAQAENRSKSEFLAHLSHELRTPLTSILGYTDLLLKQDNLLSGTNHLQIIKRNGQHLLSLLNDVLDLSKIEAGKFELEVKAVNLLEFLSDLYHLMQVKAKDKNIELNFTADTALPNRIETDPTRLRQILLNLLSNAIKFTDEGAVTMRIQWRQSGEHADVTFAIEDTGVGIDPHELNKLFKPFSQANNVESRTDPGTGLGLAISQRLAQQLGGGVEVDSVPGEGSCFTVRIQARLGGGVEASPLSLEQNGHRMVQSSTPNLKARILVTDDLVDLRQLLGHLIERTGAQVGYACNGRDAVTKVEQARQRGEPFDLVLMDMQMPEMDGLQAMQTLRERGFEQPIVALTAATMRGERERCIAAGFSDHLSKPIDERQLMERIQHHLETHSVSDPMASQPSDQTASNSILLVEDDDDTRVITAMLLESLGLSVSQAANGNEAMKAVRNTSPGLVLMDLNLPDCTGLELAGQMRDEMNGHDCTLIALSGQDMTHSELEASPFDHHLLKPVNLDILKALLA